MNAHEYRCIVRSRERTLVEIDRFVMEADRITFLFGESGIGKSIIAKAVYGLLDADALDITINGMPYRRYCASGRVRRFLENGFFVFQEPSSHLNPLMTCGEQLREGSLRRSRHEAEILGRLWGGTASSAPQQLLDIYPTTYRPSGGEKQRLLLAMAFKKIELLFLPGGHRTRPLFIFDEPTGSLDDAFRNLVIRLLLDAFSRRPWTVLFITHDYSILSEIHKNHASLLDRIDFTELCRTRAGGLRQRPFSPDRYFSWLEGIGAGAGSRDQREAVLSIDRTFSIFGKDYELRENRPDSGARSLTIHRGEMVYLKAPSGTGKTTLAKIIMGLFGADSFAMRLCDLDLTHGTPNRVWRTKIWGRRAGMVFQHADEALDLQARVEEIFNGLPVSNGRSRKFVRRVLAALFDEEVIPSLLGKKIAFLSGGQKQRLNILRTLMLRTDLLILDEPLNGLDFTSIQRVLTLLERKRRSGTAILLISHNEEIFDTIVEPHGIWHLSRVEAGTNVQSLTDTP